MTSTMTMMIAEGQTQQNKDLQIRLPGAGAAVRVKVYDQPTVDGKIGGTPHVHLLTTEMYVVLAGSGAVEVIDTEGCRTIELQGHDALVFTPGTIHRLLNPNRNLELLVIEQGGFPQHGDAVVCLPLEVLSDSQRYAEVRTVKTIADAMRRQALAVEGFNRIRQAFARSPEEGRAMLSRFYRACHACTADLYSTWESVLQEGLVAEVMQCMSRLDALTKGDWQHLSETRQRLLRGKAYDGIGYCGYLDKYGTVAPALR